MRNYINVLLFTTVLLVSPLTATSVIRDDLVEITEATFRFSAHLSFGADDELKPLARKLDLAGNGGRFEKQLKKCGVTVIDGGGSGSIHVDVYLWPRERAGAEDDRVLVSVSVYVTRKGFVERDAGTDPAYIEIWSQLNIFELARGDVISTVLGETEDWLGMLCSQIRAARDYVQR